MTIKRKNEKRYPMVDFQVPELFDGTFTLPKFDSLPLGIIRTVTKGDFNKIAEFIEQYGSEETLEAFDSLDQDEANDFFDAWVAAEDLSAPKSVKSQD